MAVYDLEEQEQLDELKTWWKQYGNLVTGILLAVAVASAGWQGWNWWQGNQTAQASAVFGALQQAAAQKDAKRSRELAGELIDKYSATAYAGMGALLAAHVQVAAGDSKNARVQLVWAAESAKDPGLRDLARLRLATVLLDDKAYDEAIKQLSAEPSASFAPRFAELRGDVFAAQGKATEAKAAYDVALAKIDTQIKAEKSGEQKSEEKKLEEPSSRAAYRDLVQVKRDASGVAK
jgi:predicted negative regulator of RcsB-dependent stress response